MKTLLYISRITVQILNNCVPNSREEFIDLLVKYEKFTDHHVIVGGDIINELAIQDIALVMFINSENLGDALKMRAALFNKEKNGSFWKI